MTEQEHVSLTDTAVKPKVEQYVYILLDTDFEEFYDVFSGVYATEEAANKAADRLCKHFYENNPVHRRHFKIRKERVEY